MVKINDMDFDGNHLLIGSSRISASPMADFGRASSLLPEEVDGFSLERVSSGLLTQPYTCGVETISSPMDFLLWDLRLKVLLCII